MTSFAKSWLLYGPTRNYLLIVNNALKVGSYLWLPKKW